MLVFSKPRVSVFPNFQTLTPDLFDYYQDFLFDFNQHCDFSLNNLLIWFGSDAVDLSVLNKNLVVRIDEAIYSNQLGGTWYAILGNKNADKTLEAFFRSNLANELTMVPDYFVEAIKHRHKWVIEEDERNRDYILDIQSLLNKKGKLYESFRYQISYFLRHHSADARLQDLNLSNLKTQLEILNSLKAWRVNSFLPGGNDRQRVDEQAIRKLIDLQPILPIKHRCIGLYIHDRLEGFSIFHVPRSDYLIGLGNHIKFNGHYKRMFDFLIFVTASRLSTEGVKYLNAEQDMGINGIRHHKENLNPTFFYKKYTIKPRVPVL